MEDFFNDYSATVEDIINYISSFYDDGFPGHVKPEKGKKAVYVYEKPDEAKCGELRKLRSENEDLKTVIDRQKSNMSDYIKEIARLRGDIESLKAKTMKEPLSSANEKKDKYMQILKDKILADGYKIVNDLKVWVEFSRKCGLMGSSEYYDMVNMVQKTVDYAVNTKK
jgi:predicted RNase H-like nuclease (RuvC/YqgF family)